MKAEKLSKEMKKIVHEIADASAYGLMYSFIASSSLALMGSIFGLYFEPVHCLVYMCISGVLCFLLVFGKGNYNLTSSFFGASVCGVFFAILGGIVLLYTSFFLLKGSLIDPNFKYVFICVIFISLVILSIYFKKEANRK